MKKKQIYILLAILMAMIVMGSCGRKVEVIDDEGEEIFEEEQIAIEGDSMLYGLCCDGSSDSVVVIWPFHGDPITYSVIDAKEDQRVIGHPEIGDWIGVMVNRDDTTSATMVINLDELKGTWTYPVMPVMKEMQNMSKRAQKRMMAHVHDSIKENFLIPREYGFTLKRGHKAQAVGRVMRSNSLEDDSPVIYPEVKNYKTWHMLNGKLVLVSGAMMMPGMKPGQKIKNEFDTLEFVSMTVDSLVLMQHGIRYGFHRQQNAMEANKAAQKKESEKK